MRLFAKIMPHCQRQPDDIPKTQLKSILKRKAKEESPIGKKKFLTNAHQKPIPSSRMRKLNGRNQDQA